VLTAIGIALDILAADVATRLLGSLLFEEAPTIKSQDRAEEDG
jgi:hypothetical protein